MKRYLITAVTVALSVMSFSGCADQGSTASTADANPSKKTYNRDDLDRTGQATTGQALKRTDPDISGGR
jgi:hypothetical protein